MKILWCLIILLSTLGRFDWVVAAPKRILIVNTDTSVARYNEIASEFRAILQKNQIAWDEYDLQGVDSASNELKQLIQSDKTDIVFCIGTKAYSVVRNYSKEKKLVFSSAINWRRLGITENTYGISNELSPIQELSLLRYFLPTVKKVGLLYNAKFSQEYVDSIKEDAKHLNMTVVEQEISDEAEIGSALEAILPNVDIFWLTSDPVVLASQESVKQIFKSAQLHSKPVYSYSDIFIDHGAVLSVSADVATIGRQAAHLAILTDTKQISAGTVQIPAGSTITVNKCALEALHQEFNNDAWNSVNKIIECKSTK